MVFLASQYPDALMVVSRFWGTPLHMICSRGILSSSNNNTSATMTTTTSADTLKCLTKMNPQALTLASNGLLPLDWALTNPNFTPKHIKALLDHYPSDELKLRQAISREQDYSERTTRGGVDASIASVLVSNDNKIRILDCTDCDFTKDGIHAILKGLGCHTKEQEKNTTALEELSLRLRIEDLMDDECPSAIRKAVGGLYRRGNKRSIIAGALKDMLMKNKSLKKLRIQISFPNNYRSYPNNKTLSRRYRLAVIELGQALGRGLKHNTVLENLEVDSGLLGTDILDIIRSSSSRSSRRSRRSRHNSSILSFSTNTQAIEKFLVEEPRQ
eukprot:CAMPEP_0116853416 /NCGR_PEP_ID=MMETSP0418-20121206/17899_1 /TAXON_ID=1158023 /ORGANISM="Astrosyne radiata, Strain 13vi08-1A" /LENGTH=328 /DNA_ID=CAMNT_0004485813 /DNA_START=278 /DNA_END=1264 /DNA_ORIENTATION=-